MVRSIYEVSGAAPKSLSPQWSGWRVAPALAPPYPAIPQFIEQSQRNQIQSIDAVSSRPSRAKGRVTRPDHPDQEQGRVSGSNQNLWASRAGEKSPAFSWFSKTRTKHGQFASGKEKGLPVEIRKPLLLDALNGCGGQI